MTHIKNIIKAIIIILVAPYILYLVCKKHYIYTIIFFALSVVIILWSLAKKVDLNIVDVQSAFNKGTIRTETKYVVIHHTAGDTSAVVNDIVKTHFKKNQWEGIGYHFFIHSNGTVYQLRNDNESQVPHAFGFNDNCVAICISGNFSEYECPDNLWEIALELTRQELKKFGLTPNDVRGHRELPGNNVECPGLLFDLDKFRNDL